MASASVWTGITVTTGIVWTNISDYVLSVGNFEQLFNNYDYSLKDCIIEIVLTNLISADLYLDPTEVKIKIVQDNKKIFVGYISETQKSEIEQTITLTVPNVIHKLFINTFDDFWDRWNVTNEYLHFAKNFSQSKIVMGRHNTLVSLLTGQDYSIITCLFQEFTGEELISNGLFFPSEPNQLRYRTWVFTEALFEYNTGKAGGTRNNTTLLSDFYAFICSAGINIFFNPNTEKFEAITTLPNFQVDPPIYPADNNIYDYDFTTNIDIAKKATYNCDYTNNANAYFDYMTETPNNTPSEQTTSILPFTDAKTPLKLECSNFFIIYEETLNVFSGGAPAANNFKNPRFNSDINKKEFETELVMNFKTEYIFVTGCQAVLRGDRFYSKLELSEII
jgi:hypothetical protein